MRALSRIVCFVMIVVAETAHGDEVVTSVVASHGESLVAMTAGKFTVRAKIATHEIDIGKPSDARPADSHSNCTYSKYPCSIVDSLKISVNDEPLVIPHSVFCDLADLNKAELKLVGKEKLLLTLRGGNASEVYTVKIWFNKTDVIRRTLSSGLMPDKTLQETTYRAVVLGD